MKTTAVDGCIRVAAPVALAEWALRDQADWTRETIAAMRGATDGK